VSGATWFAKPPPQALAYIHGEGMMHRDIKTANLFLTGPNHQLKLGDFGFVGRAAVVRGFFFFLLSK
jgi:serine/threonine protein kinase